MINVFLCEDEQRTREEYTAFIKASCETSQNPVRFHSATADPEELLALLRETADTQALCFIDIHLETTLNGIDLAVAIRRENLNCELVFLTSDTTMMPQTFQFQLKAMDYIDKGDPAEAQKRILKNLDTIVPNVAPRHFFYNTKSNVSLVPLDEIFFFATVPNSNRRVELHYVNGIDTFTGSLKQIHEDYPEFSYVHQSYLVNPEMIVSYDPNQHTILLKNGESCLVSDRNVAVVRELMRKRN